MLKHREDYRSINFIVITGLLYYGLIRINLENIGIIQHMIYFILGLIGTITVWMINHHHRHQSIFKEPIHNTLLNYLLSILMGASSTYQNLIHQHNHEDFKSHKIPWTSNDQLSKTHGLYKMINYFFQSMHHDSLFQKESQITGAVKLQIILERVLITLVAALMAHTNLINFLSFILPMWIVARFIYHVSNLLNHDGCQKENGINRTRDFISGIENWMFCNVGYSTAHFENPELHWSKLPEFHRRYIVPRKNKNLIVDSYSNYAYKYVLNQANQTKKEKSFSDLGRL